MSSVRARRSITGSTSDWVEVGEVHTPAMAALHAKLRAAASTPKSFTVDEVADYGSGDRALADDIAVDVASRWDV